MNNGLENIKNILEKYFHGSDTDDERKVAEEYLLSHPEIMEEFTENRNLKLYPGDKEEDHIFLKYRSAAEYDDQQFMLLSAAAAEGDLSPELSADFYAVIKAHPEKSALAGEFSNLKLKPKNDEWTGKSKMLHTVPLASSTRKVLALTLSVAAVITAILLFNPVISKETLSPVQSLSMAGKEKPKELSSETEFFIAEPFSAKTNSVITTVPYTGMNVAVIEPLPILPQVVYEREAVKAISTGPSLFPRLAAGEPQYIAVMSFNEVTPVKTKRITDNWMVNGLANVAMAMADDSKLRDPYNVAGAGIKEINKLLGWDMQLQKEIDANGEVKALSFQSGLLSFTAPIKNK